MIDSRFYDFIDRLHKGGQYRYYWSPKGGENGEKLSYWFNASRTEVPNVWINSDLYFSVHPSKEKQSPHQRSLKSNIQLINCLFAEFDGKNDKQKLLLNIQNLITPPSVIIDSGGGYHAYWILSESFDINSNEDLKRVEHLQYAWVDFVGSDDGAKDLCRVLRIPGTKNNKPEYNGPLTVEIIDYNIDRTYNLEALEKLVQPYIDKIIELEEQKKTNKPANPSPTNLDDKDLLNKMFASSNGADINALWNGDISKHHNDHSKADQALCNHLAFWCGNDSSRIDYMFRQSGLYRPKWERQDYRDRTIDEAISVTHTTYDPNNIHNPAAQAAVFFASNQNTTSSNSSGKDLTQIYLNELPHDEGNAQCVFAKYGDTFIYCNAYGWMFYNGTCWTSDGAESKLKRAVVDVLKERSVAAVMASKHDILKAARPDARYVNSCISLFQSLVHKSVDIFDRNINILNCANGTVDLTNGNLKEHSPFDYLTYCLDVEYKPNADYIEWLEFLNTSVSHPEMVEYLQMAVGYSITGDVSEECLFYLYGPTRSGKGTYTETILAIIGKPLGVEADFKTFTADREGDTQNFDLAPLKPARFIVSSESNSYETLNEAKVKQATGGNYIRCAYKRKDHFEYKPQFKIWLASNHPVKGDVDDDAFWGRIRVIEFPHSNLGKEDKTLKTRLSQIESLEGILAWIIQGSITWNSLKGGLPIPDTIKTSTDTHRTELDYLSQWIAEECTDLRTANNNTYTIGSVLYSNYEAWCKRNGLSPKKRRSWSLGMINKNFSIGSKKINGKTHRVVFGISIT